MLVNNWSLGNSRTLDMRFKQWRQFTKSHGMASLDDAIQSSNVTGQYQFNYLNHRREKDKIAAETDGISQFKNEINK